MCTFNTFPLENSLQQIENYIPYSGKKNTAISKVNVAWQLDHSLKVINTVVNTMASSDPKLYQENFTFLGKVLLKLRYFPKGKAKAPKYVQPPAIILEPAIIDQLALAKENIQLLEALDSNAFFKHPLFGNINKKRVIAFLNTHTKHHLKIVKQILK